MIGLRGLLWRQWRTVGNTLHLAANNEPFRAGAAITVVAVVGLLIYLLVRLALLYMQADERYADLVDPLINSLLGLFFFSIFFLVGFSTTLVIWSGLFRTESAKFLAQLPVGNRALYWSALSEGGLVAAWATLVLTIPVVTALAFHAQVFQPLPFLGAALVVLVSFLLVCMAIGGAGAVVLARLIPWIRQHRRPLIGVVAILVVIVAWQWTGEARTDANRFDYLERVLDRIGFVHNPLLPPQWSQAALRAAMDSDWPSWAYHVALLLITAAAIGVAGEWGAQRRFRIDFDLLAGRPDKDRTRRTRDLRPVLLLPRDVGLLVAKDLRMFIRDPAQVLQFGLFFGMLGFYILLLPRIGQAFLVQEWWSTAVSVLNLLAVSMALATFTGRFVYPLPSLEGKRLWILTLAPWPSHRVITAKYVFAILVGAPVATILVALSGMMLDLELPIIALQSLVTICMAFGLAAAALGIGSRLADLNEDNPAKLVAGYGGTINLLASLVFCTLLIVASCLPLLVSDPAWGWGLGLGSVLIITVLWSSIFMAIARRAFNRLATGAS